MTWRASSLAAAPGAPPVVTAAQHLAAYHCRGRSAAQLDIAWAGRLGEYGLGDGDDDQCQEK